MNRKRTPSRWALSAVVGLALASSAGLGLASTARTNSFDTADSVAGWTINYGSGTVGWASTQGVDGTGALQITLTAGGAGKVGPLLDMGTNAFNSSDYVLVEYDLMVDANSGVDANGNYGTWQEVLRDAKWSWDGHWYGNLNSSFSSWKHMKVAVPNNAKLYPMLGFELASTAATDVTVYVDNLVLTPFVNPLVFGAFTNAEEVATWNAGGRATLSFDAKNADGSAASGSLKFEAGYDEGNTGWQAADVDYLATFTPARYTYAAFDLYLENPNALTSFGLIKLMTSDWKTILEINLNASHVGKWTHFEVPVPSALTGTSDRLRLQVGGNMKAPLTYYLDNVKLYKPIAPPVLSIAKAGAAGVQLTMDDDASQWQRDGIATPAEATATGFFWSVQTYPVTYSFTVGDFPSPASHPDFEAHMFLVNKDTVVGNETYGGCDYNATDVLVFRVQNQGSGAFCAVSWKTNLPNASVPDDAVHRPVYVPVPSALGTWSLTFTDATHATVTGPGMTATNFTLPEDAVWANFSPATSFLQFGMFKNDWANTGRNNQASGTFSAVKFTGWTYPIDEKFDGATLTSNYAWRSTRDSAVSFVPSGTAWWLTWTLPAEGFILQSAPALAGPWQDAGVTTSLQRGATMIGGVPASALPPGSSVFFRLAVP